MCVHVDSRKKERESDVAEQRGAAAVGLCKALPQPRSHSSSVEAQSVGDAQPLLAEGLAIHSVVLLPQDTPRMAGCYGQPPPHPLPEYLFVCTERKDAERAKKDWKFSVALASNWQ